MQTLPFLPITRDNWTYDSPAPPHHKVWIICRTDTEATTFSALCTGDEEISFVVALSTKEKADERHAQLEEPERSMTYVESICWHTLGSYARGIQLDGEFLCVCGGMGWVATSLTWTPTSNLVGDPFTLAVGCRVDGRWVKDKEGNPIISTDVPGLLAGMTTCGVESPKPDDCEFVTKTFLDWASDYTYITYEGKTHDIRRALLSHPWTQEMLFGKDPEESILDRLGDNDDTRGV